MHKSFEIQKKYNVKDIDSTVYEITHKKTGAKYVHIQNKISENTFAVAFKTIPEDSSGIAHILEHTALCGSKKYPVRDPFFSMLKRSLSSFMNAFTSHDWTMYPFCTENKKDFFNLMGIYLDAAFFPKLSFNSFCQEGIRISYDENQPSFKGIVFNEMKGAMSSDYEIMSLSLLKSIFPDTTYKYNSGGDPKEIIKLKHEDLINFHKRYYHPSNAFFYSFGNIPLDETLSFIEDNVLKHFKKIDPKSKVLPQKRWKKEKTFKFAFAHDNKEDLKKKYQASMVWLTQDIKDFFDCLVMFILEQALLGNEASYLKSALINSKLGTSLSDASGFHADQRETFFSVGLKNIEKKSSNKVKEIILKTLKKLAEKGISKELIEGAIHQIELSKKEITNTPYPFGLKVLLNISSLWFHDADISDVFFLDKHIKEIRSKIKDKNFLASYIKKYFLDNKHNAFVILEPDLLYKKKEEKYLQKELGKICKNFSQKDIKDIIRKEKEIQKEQGQKEDLSVLPTLEIKDISKKIKIVHPSEKYKSNPNLSVYEENVSDVFYLNLLAGTKMLKESDYVMLPLLSYIFNKSKSYDKSYAKISKLIDLHTGGISLSFDIEPCLYKQDSYLNCISLSSKCLNRKQKKMYQILEEITFNLDFSDTKRLGTLLSEKKSYAENSIVQNAHRYAILLATKNLSKDYALKEEVFGINSIEALKTLCENVSDEKLKEISEKLSNIYKKLFTENTYKYCLIGNKKAFKNGISLFCDFEKNFAKDLKKDDFSYQLTPFKKKYLKEAYATNSSVSFNASVFEVPKLFHKDSAALSVISKMIQSLYLHKKIREEQGAYGAMCSYDGQGGFIKMATYRDPCIVESLKHFDEAVKFINSNKYNETDIKEAILQIASDMDKASDPASDALRSFWRNIIGIKDEERAEFKEELLSLNKDKITKIAEKYFIPNNPKKSIAIISNETMIKDAQKKIKDIRIIK